MDGDLSLDLPGYDIKGFIDRSFTAGSIGIMLALLLLLFSLFY
jgi:uncharacterized protein (DUF3820 family)